MNTFGEKTDELIAKAVESLILSTGLIATPHGTKKPDSSVSLTIKHPNIRHQREYKVFVKLRLNSDAIGTIIAEIKHASLPALLVTSYVTPDQASRLRETSTQFLDTAGNAFIQDDKILVFITGNRPSEKLLSIRQPRAFTTAGIKVTFALITCPQLVNATYREIASAAGVSLGSIPGILKDLGARSFLIDMGREGRILRNQPELIRRWSEAYAERLRPKLLTGRFSSRTSDWWQTVNLEEYQACWGGEIAAAKLTNYLKPELFSIYSPSRLPKLQVKYGFRPEPEGKIELLHKFWNFGADQSEIAPALLIYADLLASGDERNRETAEALYEEYLT